MNWNQELLNSAIWVAKAYAITLVVFVAVMALLARATVWGRQFWSLTGAYFSPRRSWRPCPPSRDRRDCWSAGCCISGGVAPFSKLK